MIEVLHDQRRHLATDALNALEVRARVLVVHVVRRYVHLELGAVVLHVLVVRQQRIDLDARRDRRLVRPHARHVARRVAAAADDEQRQAERLDEGDAVGVSAHRQIEAAELILGQRVGAALQHDRAWTVPIHDRLNDRPEDEFVRVIVDAVAQRHVDRVVLPAPDAPILDVARAREEVAELVQRAGHHAVRRAERLLDAVAVMDVDVDVEDALVYTEQLENAEHDVCESAPGIVATMDR